MKRKFWPILWLTIFLLGSAASFLYVQGFRLNFREKEIIATGILDVSTAPKDTLIFLDNVFKGVAPQVLRGIPLGTSRIRLEHSGFLPFTGSVQIQGEYITHLHRLFLIPLNLNTAITTLGPSDQVAIDPQGRGYARIFPEQKTLEITDLLTEEKRVQEFPETPIRVLFTDTGQIREEFSDGSTQVQSGVSDPLFRSFPSLLSERALSPEGEEILFFKGKKLFRKNLQSEISTLSWEDAQEIKSAWWLQDSDDTLVVTNREIFFWNIQLSLKRKLVSSLQISDPLYIPDRELLLYKDLGIWKSVNIGML